MGELITGGDLQAKDTPLHRIPPESQGYIHLKLSINATATRHRECPKGPSWHQQPHTHTPNRLPPASHMANVKNVPSNPSGEESDEDATKAAYVVENTTPCHCQW